MKGQYKIISSCRAEYEEEAVELHLDNAVVVIETFLGSNTEVLLNRLRIKNSLLTDLGNSKIKNGKYYVEEFELIDSVKSKNIKRSKKLIELKLDWSPFKINQVVRAFIKREQLENNYNGSKKLLRILLIIHLLLWISSRKGIHTMKNQIVFNI